MSHNSVCVEGNLTRDSKFWPASGEKKDFAVFTVACNVGRSKDDAPIYFEVKTSGYLAKQAATLTKGQRVIVSGRLVNDDFTDKEGVSVKRVGIFADEVSKSSFISLDKAESNEPAEGESVGF